MASDQRQADALERIADALEKLVAAYTPPTTLPVELPPNPIIEVVPPQGEAQKLIAGGLTEEEANEVTAKEKKNGPKR
jgi:hypothetical protein